MHAIALRLKPQQDLKIELDRFVETSTLESACILTGVGSLVQATLRLANQSQEMVYQGHFEIVSLMGVMSKHGSHYHMAIADEKGNIKGGHLLKGCLVYTTIEIVIGVFPYLRFQREYDQVTRCKELTIYPVIEAPA